MGKIFQKAFQPPEDKAKTRLLELIHSDMNGAMQTQTVHGNQCISMFTDDHSRYTNLYFTTGKSENPAKCKECGAKVEKPLTMSKVCQIKVDC